MALWSAWNPDVLPKVAGCPQLLIEHELKRAAQEFFEETFAWKVLTPAVSVLADDEEILVAPSDPEQELVRIEQAWYDGQAISPKTIEELDAQFADDWKTHTGTPGHYIEVTPGTVRLYPIPTTDAVSGLACRISVRPSDSATGIPDAYRTKYRKALSDGALGALLLYPSAAWSAADHASLYRGAFESAKNKAGVDSAQSFGKARISARPKWC